MNNKMLMLSLVTVFFLLGVVSWSLVTVFIYDDDHIYFENGALENIQVALIALSFLGFLAAALLSQSIPKMILLFLALACYVSLLRELPIEELAMPDTLKALGYGTGRNISIGLLVLPILVYAALNAAYYLDATWQFLKSDVMKLLLVAVLFLAIGDFFDKKILKIEYNLLLEEIAELFAYVFLLLAAVVACVQDALSAANSYAIRRDKSFEKL